MGAGPDLVAGARAPWLRRLDSNQHYKASKACGLPLPHGGSLPQTLPETTGAAVKFPVEHRPSDGGVARCRPRAARVVRPPAVTPRVARIRPRTLGA
jgi:hypothetical protein